ncbi:hypothetical protein ACMD2_26698, partial [Ananas comosus]
MLEAAIKKIIPAIGQNAIGAIDGTHIPVVVERSKQAPFRCRKGFTSQNMMVADGKALLPI